MFFASVRIRFFKISWLDCEQYGKNQHKKKEHNEHGSVFKLFDNFHNCLNVTGPLINPIIFIFLRLMITKNSVVKIQNLFVNHES